MTSEGVSHAEDFVTTYLNDIGITAKEDQKNFLYPKLQDLPDPFRMKNMREAAETISQWILTGNPFLIWGDYDVDGVTATATLYTFLTQSGAQVEYFIPDREEHGYGLNAEVLKEKAQHLKREKYLIITVDCGISNSHEIAFLREMGVEIIVTDHHQIPEKGVPDCLVINCSQPDCGFHGFSLAGAGIAFFLAVAVRKTLNEKGFYTKREKPNLKKLLALTAIGTVADLVALTPVNRLLVKAGFEALSDKNMITRGLKELLDSTDLENGIQTAEEISFKIAPLLNSGGRMGFSSLPVDTLLEDDDVKSREKVKKLTLINVKRKRLCHDDLERIVQGCNPDEVRKKRCAVLWGDYHPGITGILASKLVELFGYPAIVFSECRNNDSSESMLKGSCRSIAGFDILDALGKSKDCLVTFGGHTMAAGVTLKKANFIIFHEIFQSTIPENVLEVSRNTTSTMEYNVGISTVFNKNFLQKMVELEPHGIGCPKPYFIDHQAKTVFTKAVGQKGEHLQMTLRGKYKNLRAIGFRKGHMKSKVEASDSFSIKYTPMLNTFNKVESWQALIHDIFE